MASTCPACTEACCGNSGRVEDIVLVGAPPRTPARSFAGAQNLRLRAIRVTGATARPRRSLSCVTLDKRRWAAPLPRLSTVLEATLSLLKGRGRALRAAVRRCQYRDA